MAATTDVCETTIEPAQKQPNQLCHLVFRRVHC